MFRVIVVPANSTANVVLLYKSRETAEIAQKNIHDMQKGEAGLILTAKDDFGHILTIRVQDIVYSLFIDPDKQRELTLDGAPVLPRSAANGSAESKIIM